MKLARLILTNSLTRFVLVVQLAHINVAIAATFTDPDKEISAFKQKPGDEPVMSFGASEPFHSQITPGAPLQVLLPSEDFRLKATGRGIVLCFPESRITHTISTLEMYGVRCITPVASPARCRD